MNKKPFGGADFLSRADFRSGRVYITQPVSKKRHSTNTRLNINAPTEEIQVTHRNRLNIY